MDLFTGKSFKALESSLNAQWMQAQVSLQNLGNLETPGYKAQSLSFEDTFQNLVGDNAKGPYNFRAKLTTDTTTVVRPDGNNVDSDAESVKLFKSYLQTEYMQRKISGSFNSLKYVLENGPR